jgi:malonate transporter
MIENLIFSINAVAPIFLMVFLGAILKKKGIINDNFASKGSDFVFKVAFPALLFRDVAITDFTSVFNVWLVLFAIIGTILQFIILWILSSVFIKEKTKLGAFVQGSFRGNFLLIGLSLAYNLFGESGLAKCAILLSFIIPLYNVLATVVLTVTSQQSDVCSLKGIAKSLMKNPLILSILLAIPFSYFKIQLPVILSKPIEYLSDLALPIALICMGCNFSLAAVKRNIKLSLTAVLIKIIAAPLIFASIAFYLGFRNEELGSLFILFGAPTAVTSFIMAKAMKSDSDLAANIVLMSTLGSILTLFAGIFLFKHTGML